MALWGGRFADAPSDALAALSRSVHFDWRLAPYDLDSSQVHLTNLLNSNIVSQSDFEKIRAAIDSLRADVISGKALPNGDDEDVHSALERILSERIGELGSSLRAGRSRNDQIATDLRLYLRDVGVGLAQLLLDLEKALAKLAADYSDAPAPGFTHLQHAQPVIFGHELAKHAHALSRDIERLQQWWERTGVSPLGAGALSGSALSTDPVLSAHTLGFHSSAENSIDAVRDRDFAAEFLFIAALIGVHLSQIGEEWTIWATTEFGWAKLNDAYSTGSSIMPQKKNPDIAELARGKSGRLIGDLTGLLVTLKGLPFAYNRDLQEDKEPVFDAVDTLEILLPALTGMVSTTIFDREKMAIGAPLGFSLATEIADFLAKEGVVFAHAHEVAGKAVALCESSGRQLENLTLAELSALHPKLTDSVKSSLSVKGALEARDSYGATSPKQVRAQLSRLDTLMVSQQQWIETRVIDL
jgi:argininosuccinate lyase